MARTVQVHLLDDIDGTSADETVRFGLDGVLYEIDLNAVNAKELRSALGKYVGGARRAGRGAATSAPARAIGSSARTDREQNQAIREWAKRRKVALSARGRIPRSVIEQYEAEAGR